MIRNHTYNSLECHTKKKSLQIVTLLGIPWRWLLSWVGGVFFVFEFFVVVPSPNSRSFGGVREKNARSACTFYLVHTTGRYTRYRYPICIQCDFALQSASSRNA